MENLSQILRERRRALGMTQDQLAERIHVSRQTVSHWETGRVRPDMENLRLLAEILEFSVTIGGDPQEDASTAADEPAPDAGAEESGPLEVKAPKRKRALWSIIPAALAVLAAVLGVVLIPGAPMKAEIVVTPQDGESYLIYTEKFPNGGWDVPFYFENVSEVPFRLERIEAHFYQGDVLKWVIVVPADHLWPHMSSEWLRKGDFPLCWPFGTDHLYLSHMVCTIYGTDSNGNELHFSGSVRYMPEPPAE